jgi:cytochrome c oxidase subunit 2
MTAGRRFAAVCAAAVVTAETAACRGVQDMMAPAGPAAYRIAVLGWFVLIIFIAVTAVMWVLVFRVAWHRRGQLATHLPFDADDDRRWIVVGGFTIPVMILGVIFVVMLKSMSAFPMGDAEMGTPADIRVTGYQWWWQIEYLTGGVSEHVEGANEIHIPAGRPVDIELRTHDVIHSFWVPRLHGKIDLVPEVVNRIRIQADNQGTYRGQCAEFCGPQHAHMIFYVVAHPAQEYAAWLERARQPSVVPDDPFAQRGQQVFLSNQCALCHTIRGTAANGRLGPDLTHVGSRLGIAANTLPNDVASVTAWVTHAQSLKPYSQMPNITAFTGEEIRALTTYLSGLK